MITDNVNKESNGKKIIEILIEDGGMAMWLPVMATDLRIMNNESELVKVTEIRVRDLEKEI